jgi:hemoglobin
MFCGTCHGTDGKREIPMITGGMARLDGMDQQKFANAMKAYKYGQRFHPMMQFFVMPVNDQDIEDLAAFYATQGPSLYQRLGGKEAINMVVKDLLANGMADARLNPRLSKMDGARCERQLTDLLCQATGGPCKYNGRDMKTAHTGAKVTETEWQAFAENLMKTFNRFNVPERERNDLLQMLLPMKADIVGL